MDYLEGFLIGPVWSDTDYETRRHYHAHVLLALLFAGAFFLLTLKPDWAAKVVVVDYPLSFILLGALVVLTPILSSFYYRIPLVLRPLVLLVYVFKYVLLFYLILHFLSGFVPETVADLPQLIMTRMDHHITQTTGFFQFAGSLFGMILGIVFGGLWIVAEALLLVAAAIVVPLIIIGLFKLLQLLLDRLLEAVLFRGRDFRGAAGTDEIGAETLPRLPSRATADEAPGETTRRAAPVSPPSPMPEPRGGDEAPREGDEAPRRTLEQTSDVTESDGSA